MKAVLSKRSTALMLLAAGLLCACTTPAIRFHEAARTQGLKVEQLPVGAHAVDIFMQRTPAPGEALHVYLDGDGKPWLSKVRIARDPTTRERLVLDLMQQDPAPSVLVGRPCYYGASAGCDPLLWTNGRYGEPIVAAMTSAIGALGARWPDSPVVLIGYSGGGALAMLIAPRLPQVSAVLTLAANVDVGAWAAHHGAEPLAASLDPALLPPLPSSIRQWHFYGEDDDNVPAAAMQAAIARQPGAELQILPGFDHRCCWAQAWPGVLSETVLSGALQQSRTHQALQAGDADLPR